MSTAETVPGKKNSKSILSLSLAVISFVLPVFGLAVAVAAIMMANTGAKEIQQSGRVNAGENLALTAKIISGVSIVIQLMVLIGVIAFYV
ncbi:hypothetical protein B0H94_11176 [Salsuginibacillus halophilus]|uniref:DUF4190 domain-containing protein n=1 Tax=Salsuginibacillus halophilus TaxID=517424 RepID=A0A2P8HAK3_9BACI|nr:hypothetical protein [Salsuginibacillus halophilus]PSL43252.1 hypothetical protein B0H94_11176 [Salsuginibacillus halophilus]